jgi:GNAT superfamily N-acetyltransferase
VERAPPSHAAIREVTSADVPALARTLAEAFYVDPVMRWMLPDDAQRRRQADRWFALLLRETYLPSRACYTTDGVLGGALWMPPGKSHPTASAQLVLLRRMAPIVERDLPRLLGALSFIGSRRPHPPHYYLAFLGVQPESQGKGIGTSLLRPILERCDHDRTPAYLEATSARNSELYSRNGFALIEELAYPNGGPRTWRMWREPRMSARAGSQHHRKDH